MSNDNKFFEDVGRRISTFRPSKDKMCYGKILAYDAAKDLHTICFEDDSSVEVLTLDSYRLVVTSDIPHHRHKQSASKSERGKARRSKKRRRDKSEDLITETKLVRTVSDFKAPTSSKNSEDLSEKRLEDVQKGDRIARDFGGTIYFGQVEQVKVDQGNGNETVFTILFDDGDCFELDSIDMARALKLYEACKRFERNDPQIQSKIDKMEEDFNKEKREILRQLPDRMKNQFRQIGFAQYESRSPFRPVIFLSPYDVFYPVRTPWLRQFKKAKKSDLSKTPWIVYWYGEQLEHAFSLVSSAQCLSYSEARERGVADMPKDIRQKIRRQKKLGKSEEKLYNIWTQMQADVDKEPADRIHFEKPKEDHELVKSGKRLFMEIEAELDRFMKTSDVC